MSATKTEIWIKYGNIVIDKYIDMIENYVEKHHSSDDFDTARYRTHLLMQDLIVGTVDLHNFELECRFKKMNLDVIQTTDGKLLIIDLERYKDEKGTEIHKTRCN